MRVNTSTIATDRSATLPTQLVAIWCMLVLLVSSGLQATHFHHPLVQASVHSGLNLQPVGSDGDTDANCPLCVNSESALPECSPTSLPLLFTFDEVVPFCKGRLVPTEVAFEQAIRPPPIAA